MHYTQLFRNLRETKGLSHDSLAGQAACHRNTVINVEGGRPVKFKTIAELMAVMGYDCDSTELKSIALLWLKSVSGVDLSTEESAANTRRSINGYQVDGQQAAQILAESVIANDLTVGQIHTLLFVSQQPQVLALVERICALVGEAKQSAADESALQTAEKGDIGVATRLVRK